MTDLEPDNNDRYGWNDIGNGNLFADWYKSVARYVPERKQWFVYLEKKEEERFDYYAWRDQMIREHYADFEAAGYFDRHPEQRPSLEPRTNPEESTPPGEV